MIKHIVMFKMKPVKDLTPVHDLKDKLEALKNKIAEIRHLETGLNISGSPSAFDLVLVTEFDNQGDLDTYRMHPDHQEVVGFINSYVEEVRVVDYSK